MTGPVVAAAPRLTVWWLRVYTRGLPAELRDRRRGEIESDVHEQLAEAHGRPGAMWEVVGRTARGAVDDLAWRREQGSTMDVSSGTASGLRRVWAAMTQAWFAPAAALLVVFNVGLAVAIGTEDAGKAPGNVVGPVLIVVLGLCLATGLLMRSAGARGEGAAATWRGRTAVAAGLALALLVLLAIIGVGGRPVLLAAGLVLVAVVAGVVSRRPSSSVVADGLVLVGTLPALAFFWWVVPALLALIVIVGVLGAMPARRATLA